ncbi:lytic transglycosylase domain-containing protein [Desulfospira joergensenii]|uniref:lytic transglycosylase domain-containing protein n=1 Tax=Desulfospira joergensenii TaxID=53329 RepID=UPI0003B30B77|nr:lytic transglycosylase domain-containing protein [Desulfospira joergensenii]
MANKFFSRAVPWLSLFILVMGPVRGICEEPESPSQVLEQIPSLIQSIRFQDELRFCGVKIPLENHEVKQRLEKEMLLALWNRPQVILWIKRGARYFPHIDAILAKENLPLDLRYVPVIESALRPHASSPAGAVGFWQFLKHTGRKYGLTINSRIDQRRNIFESTRAACQYIKKLNLEFGSYLLALSAYNMGEHGLKAEIESQDTRDYFSLYLSLETQRYIFKILAAKLILENPETYGFHLKHSDLYPVFSFSKLEFSSNKEIPLTLIAGAADVSFKIIKDMNPEIRGYSLGPGKSVVLVPQGREKGFKEKFTDLHKSWKAGQHLRFHVVKPGESLTGIAKQYNVSIASLLRLNNLTLKKVIHPGDRLKVRY